MIYWQSSDHKMSEPLGFVGLFCCFSSFFVFSAFHIVGLLVLLLLWGRDLAPTCVSATEE